MKSCYILEFSVQPGVARHAEVYVVETLEALRRRVNQAVLGEPGPEVEVFLASYLLSDPTFGVWVVQRGRVTWFVDLRPHVALVDRAGRPMRLDHAGDLESLGHLIARDPDHPVSLGVDWGAIAALVPPLEPPLLAPGEATEVTLDPVVIPSTGTYLQSGEVEHGSWDLETGENLDAERDGGVSIDEVH